MLALGTITVQAQWKAKSTTKLTNIETSYPYWSPDGTQIVFQSDRNDGNSEIYTMKADGTDIKRLTTNKGMDETPIWSPDGKHILFCSDRDHGNVEIYLMDTDGKNQRNISNHPAHDGHPNISPDGKRIIFHSNRNMHPDSAKLNPFGKNSKHDLFEMDLDGKNIKQVTESPRWDTYPDISPDGKKIAFRRIIPSDMSNYTSNSEVFVADRDGKNAFNLSKYPDHDGWPAWSPDGKIIAFASDRERLGNWQLYLIHPDGTGLKRLTEFDSQEAVFAKPQWSPDGKRLICTRSKDGNVEIFIVELEPDTEQKK
jgi:TolB protein